MVNRKSRRRQEKRLPVMDVAPAPDLGAMPPREDRAEPLQLAFPVTASDHVARAQVVQRTTECLSTGRLVDFAVMFQQWSARDSRWIDIVRVDTAHRQVHVHRVDLDEGQVDAAVVPADCRSNIDRAYQWAIGYIWECATADNLRFTGEEAL